MTADTLFPRVKRRIVRTGIVRSGGALPRRSPDGQCKSPWAYSASLGMAIAGCLIWLLLNEAGNIDRRSSFWVARVVGLAVLILILLMVAIFLLLGGPMLPPL